MVMRNDILQKRHEQVRGMGRHELPRCGKIRDSCWFEDLVPSLVAYWPTIRY